MTAYDLRRKLSSEPDEPRSWTDVPNIWTTGSRDLEYTLGGLDNGTSYDIQVRAVNPAGPGTWSVTGKGIPRTTAGRPAITAIEAVHQNLEIEWTAPLDSGGNEISAYDVRRKRTLDPDVPASWTEILGVWKSGDSTDLTYLVGGLVNGTEYDVQVRAVNDAGPGTWSLSDSGTPVTVPGAPAIVSVEPFDQSLEFSWLRPTFDGFAGIDSFDLRHKKSRDPDLPRFWTEAIGIRTGSGRLEYTLSGLANGTAYDLQVRAVNDAGAGGWSATRAGTPRTAPDPPSISSVTAGDRSLTIRWRAPPENGGAEITSFDLRSKHSQDPDVPSSWKEELEKWTTGAGALEFTLTQLANGTPYDVQVRAENSAGGSGWSGTAPGTPVGVPLAPAITKLTAGDRTLTVTWDSPSDLAGNTLEGYSIRYKASSAPDNNRSWTGLIDAWQSGTALDHAIDQLKNGDSYDVQVRVETDADPGPWSQLRSATPRTVPPAPQAQSVDPLDRSLVVKWRAPSGNGGAEITAYDIQYRQSDPDQPGSWTDVPNIWTTGSRDLEYTLGGLDNGTSYDIQVRAVNPAGPGTWSVTGKGIPRTTAGRPAITAIEAVHQNLEIEWTAPLDSGGNEISAYDVRRKRTLDPDVPASWTEILGVWKSGDSTDLTYLVGGLVNGTEYDVQVRAVNDAGPGTWSLSDSGTPVTVPGAPAIVSVEPFDQSLEFSWLRPTFDGFAGIDSFDLRHKKSRDPDLPRFWTEAIGIRTGSGRLEYTLSGLANGTAYDLQVRAVNDAGAGGWSATRAGTPRTAPDPPSISSVTAGDRSLTIRWRAPPENGGAEITSFDLRSKHSQDPDVPSSWKEELEKWTTGAGALEFTLTQLANGTPYDVQVRAENSAGGSGWSGTAPGTPVGVPLAPAITKLTAGDRTLTVTWDSPSDLAGNTLEGYSIRYKASSAPDNNRSWTGLIDAWQSGTALDHAIDQLKNGDSYDVQVRVETDADPGPWSQLRQRHPQDRAAGPSSPKRGSTRPLTGSQMAGPVREPVEPK